MAVINTTSKNLKKYKADTVQRVKNLVSDSIERVELMATRDAPNFVSVDKKMRADGLSGEVGVMGNDPLAAYFEFGTGLSAKEILAPYPQWIKNIAMEFYINGRGTLTGKPYLYNNFLVVESEFRQKLTALLDEQADDN